MINLNPNAVWRATLKADNGKPSIDLPAIMTTTESLLISNNVWELFPKVDWVFKYSSEAMENGSFYIGRPVDLYFSDDTREDIVTFSFCIYSLNNLPGSTPNTMGDLYQITMVPMWVFQQEPKSKAYSDKIGNIITEVVDEELSAHLKPGVVVDTYDTRKGIRYRTKQTPISFWKERIIPYLKGKDGTSIFAFTTLENTIDIIDVSRMRDQEVYTIISKNHPSLPVFEDVLNNNEKNKLFLFPHSNTLSVGNTSGGGIWPLLNPKLITLSTSSAGVVKRADIEPTLPNMTNNFKKKFTLVDSSKSKESGKVYMDDSLRAYEDIFSEKMNTYSRDLLNATKFTSSCYFNPYVKLGRMVNLYVTLESDNRLSLFAQTYIITGITHKIDKRIAFTIVEYTTTSFSSNDSISGVSNTLLSFPD